LEFSLFVNTQLWKYDTVSLNFWGYIIDQQIAATPMNILAPIIFGNAMMAVYLIFRPLPTWAFAWIESWIWGKKQR